VLATFTQIVIQLLCQDIIVLLAKTKFSPIFRKIIAKSLKICQILKYKNTIS